MNIQFSFHFLFVAFAKKRVWGVETLKGRDVRLLSLKIREEVEGDKDN